MSTRGDNNMSIKEYIEKFSISEIVNNMNEQRKTTDSSIVFSNGWCASIIDKTKQHWADQKLRYSVAVCDWDGYFNWNILKQFGANEHGTYLCDTEDEVCEMLENIRNLKNIRR